MIRIIPGERRTDFPREIDAMHALRRKVFHDKLRWEVPVINRWEVDGFDVLNPLYLLSIGEGSRVMGGLRLLPTMGFNMLNDVFDELLPNGERIESPLIWESSRFAVDYQADVPMGPKGMGRATAELGLAMNDVGRAVGLTHIVTVYDALLHRILKRAGCAGEPISTPKRIGSVLTYAVFFEIGDEMEAALRAASGITGPVLESGSTDRLRLRTAA